MGVVVGVGVADSVGVVVGTGVGCAGVPNMEAWVTAGVPGAEGVVQARGAIAVKVMVATQATWALLSFNSAHRSSLSDLGAERMWEGL